MVDRKVVNAGNQVFWTVTALVIAILFFHDLDQQTSDRMLALRGEESAEPVLVAAAYNHGLVSGHVGWILCVVGLGILYSVCRLRKEFADFYNRVEPTNPDPPPLP